MNRLIVLGIVLSFVIFLPRVIKLVPPDMFQQKPEPTTAPAVTSVPSTVTPATTPPPDAASDADVQRLQGQVKKLWEMLQAEKKAREDAVQGLQQLVRNLAAQQQLERITRAVEAKQFAVPEWNAPFCFKAVLKPGDMAKYFKMGVGLVQMQPPEDKTAIGDMVAEMLLSYLQREKPELVRLYRETAEHAQMLTDVVPPERRDAKAPAELRIGSPQLNATLQCDCVVTTTGGLRLKARLYGVPSGALLFETEKSGDRYDDVTRAVALAVAALNFEDLKKAAGGN